jgi:serine/threonine-protein kinase RsbW
MAPGRAFADCAPITRPAVLESLPDLQDHVAACAARREIEPGRAENLALALEEVFVNICRYAYPDSAGAVTLACGGDGDDLVVELSDQGRPFDPSGVPEPDLGDGLDGRPVGGLGWFLVARMVDDLQCRRQDGRNIVRLILHGRRGEPG